MADANPCARQRAAGGAGVRFEIGMIDRWAKYNRVHMNFQGLTGWREVGIGWHGVNRRRGNLGAGLFFWIDPLTVDDTIPYDDRNDAQLFYADARIKRESLDLTLRYGYGINRAIEANSHEINILAYYTLTKSWTWGWLMSINVYSGEDLPDYTRVGTILTYAF